MSGKNLLSALKGAGIALAAMLGLLLLANLIALKTTDPDRLIPFFVYGIQAIGGILAGWLAARLSDGHCILTGAVAGGMLAVFLVLGAAFTDGSFSLFRVFIVGILLLALGTAGGFLGKRKAPSGIARRRAILKKLG